jgi:hypothetical protein
LLAATKPLRMRIAAAFNARGGIAETVTAEFAAAM